MAVATQNSSSSSAKQPALKRSTTNGSTTVTAAAAATKAKPTSTSTTIRTASTAAKPVATTATRSTASTAARSSTPTPTAVRTTVSATSAAAKAPVQRSASLRVTATSSATNTRATTPTAGVQRSASLKVSGAAAGSGQAPSTSRSSTPVPAVSTRSTPASPSVSRKPSTTSSTTTGTTRRVTPASSTPTSATARTTTSIRITPGTNGSTANKPPTVGGRPSANMTQTTIRTPPTTVSIAAAATTKPNSSSAVVSKRTSSITSPTATKPPTAPSTPMSRQAGSASSRSAASSVSARRVSSSSTMSIASAASSQNGGRTTTISSSKTATPTTAVSPVDLKRAIANISAKLEEASARLKTKEEELVRVRRQLEDESSWLAAATETETSSSDGGDTMVPELDYSKISAQDKEVVALVLAAKEKEVARTKNHLRTLKARIQRLRMEQERKTLELDQLFTKSFLEKDTTRTRLQQDLSSMIRLYNEKFMFQQKFDDARILHASTLQELRRIHEDKLQCLAQELDEVKRQQKQQQQPPKNRPSSSKTGGKPSSANKATGERHRKDLEVLKKSHEKEKSQLLKDHEELVKKAKAAFQKELSEAVAEHEVEVKERLDYELSQIKASHTGLVQDRGGENANMIQVLQERHQRALEELRSRLDREHKHYLDTVQNKQHSDLASLATTHTDLVNSLETRLLQSHSKFTSDKETLEKSQIDLETKAKKDHYAEKIIRRAKHMEELSALETTTKAKMQIELDTVQEKFTTFVGEIQAVQDQKLRELETSYETRIAELIVEHENRVRELEDGANEQVQEALERVEDEFDRDRAKQAALQAQERQRLENEHDVVLESLGDKLTEAENRAKAAREETKQLRKKIEREIEVLKQDMESQLVELRTSMTTLAVEHEARGRVSAEEQERARAAALEKQKLVYQKKLTDVLTKTEEDARLRRERLQQEIQTLKSSIKTTHSERDKTRAVIVAKEARWREGHSAAIKGLTEKHESSLKEIQQSAQRRLSEITKTRQQAAEGHAEKMSDLLCTHQQELQAVHLQLAAQLKAKGQADREQIQALEARVTAAQLSKGASGSNAGSNSEREQLEKLVASLRELKKQNDTLRIENEQMTQMTTKLQVIRA
ncbi:hypothetical protein BGZ83_000252 [Gryganskiella cystojenkinii]|nr:hypothetical protein BGZ83_000252 [Gryganskiella cystojenkinii]